MLTEERVREIIRTESDDGGGCLALVLFVSMLFFAVEFIGQINYRIERLEKKAGIPACIWDAVHMGCK